MCFSLSPACPRGGRSRGCGRAAANRKRPKLADAPRPSTCLSQIISRAHVQMQKRACLLSQMSRALIGRASQPAREQQTDRTRNEIIRGERRRVGSPGAFRFRRCLCRVESLLVKVCGRYSLLVTPHLASNMVSSSPVHSRITITIQAH